MSKVPTKRGQIVQNPLAVIATLITLVEAAFAYPVTRLDGANQTIFVVFMVAFPVLLMTGFFFTVWCRPGHLYAPKDYPTAADFLRGIGKGSAIPPSATPEPSIQVGSIGLGKIVAGQPNR